MVVGAGAVARRKAVDLRDCGARVTLVAPDAKPFRIPLRAISEPYCAKYLEGALLVFAATGDAALNRRIAGDAAAAGAMANVADDPERCDFILSASLRIGRAAIAFSTGCASPSLAQRMRDRAREIFADDKVERSVRRIAKKLLHAPMENLNKLGSKGECIQYAEFVRRLFDLGEVEAGKESHG